MAWQLSEGYAYLAKKDKRMAEAIQKIGMVVRKGDEPLFDGLMQSIIGQQISLKAADTVWRRLTALLGTVTADTVASADVEALQACGMSMRKATYLQDAARAIEEGSLDLDALTTADDETCIAALTKLRGVGRWTAEMLLIFSLSRPNVMSYDDFGLRKGLCILYHHKNMPRARFERYRKRFSPYGTAASLLLWEISAGRLTDTTTKAQ